MRSKLFIALACMLIACSQPHRAADVAPDELLGMDKIVAMEGEKALERIKKIHKGEIKYVEDVAMLHYIGDGKFVTLWVTVYPTKEIAKQETESMAGSMLEYNRWAKNLEKISIGGRDVYKTSPNGTQHYFWAKNCFMFYFIPRNLNQTEIVEFIAAVHSSLCFLYSYS